MKHSSRIFVALGATICSSIGVVGSDASVRPRGVGPEFSKYYKDSSTFTCISNPSIQIPFSAVNDDYCDCPDGSDEPGTSACAYVSQFSPFDFKDDRVNRTPVLPGFYCVNKGHRPSVISFQRVNDGVCDYEMCCDGSDEWARVGGLKCENRCKEIGKEWRKNEEKRHKSLTAAVKKRAELVKAAVKLRKEVEDRISDLEVEVVASESKVQNLEQALETVRANERGKVVKGQNKGKVNVLAGLAKERVEELRGALVQVRRERDENLVRVSQLEAILSKFKEEYNPNFNDEGVKRAVRAWEDYAARGDTGSDGDEALNRDLDEICKPDGENSGIDWDHWENEQDVESEISLLYKVAAYLPDSLINYFEDKVLQLRSFLISNGILADNSGDLGTTESRAVTEARNALSTEESSLNRIRSELEDQKLDLHKDYGSDSVFRSLKGSCISKDSGEYTYELCWMEKTKQIPKKGGSTTTMGTFSAFTTITVDEQDSNGKVVPQKKIALEYTNGQTCWNGPARSTKIVLECGEQDEILKVTEDEKCVYSMFVTTPAACEEVSKNSNAARDDRKDEL
ncbi:vacuolar system associated protein-60 [Histoplasma capsulatum var. duboisii H88]|uniref:Glucosidase 2 subunit beta n=1 Tax=Ajellomyces capsulatus (strain H88) TaxID=544711 RepID=F0URI1_AJEC8|nr:vacuolar system associated protein-60 [Histoplasma capsulatum var. duboisii H88]QSS50522.1 vacuolar sorting-associated protein [Histoplasma capsulatum var. duboisii H88]